MPHDLNAPTEYAALLGRRVIAVDAEARSIEVAYEARPDFANRAGFVAGGMLSAMLDSLTGLAALAVLPEGAGAVHTRLEVDYVSRARPGRLVGRARVTAMDGDTVRCEGALFDTNEKTVARAAATLRIVS
jgi:uncharacterized protein (TIGR00369 family)